MIKINNPYEYIKKYEKEVLSYNKFCDIINEPLFKGKKRTIQLKNISNYMSLTRGYDKITINKVYNENEMLLIEHNVKFTEYISDLIVMYLANSTQKMETLTYKEFAEYFYMVNKDYYKAKYKKHNYTNNFKIQTNMVSFTKDDGAQRIHEDIGIFFNITDRIIKEIIKNALKSLRNKGLILYSDNFKLYKNVPTGINNTYITKTYVCNKKQRKEFLDVRKNIMKKHHIEKLQDIIYLNHNSRESYFQDLKYNMAKSAILNHCTKYANAFNIEYGDKAIEYEYKRLLQKNKGMINNNMQYKLLTTKELKCINDTLKSQFIDNFIDVDKK